MRGRGLSLRALSPLHVAAYIRTLRGSVPTVKQHLAAIRVLCDWPELKEFVQHVPDLVRDFVRSTRDVVKER